MVLFTKIAERLGLFDILAPRNRERQEDSATSEKAATSTRNRTRNTMKGSHPQQSEENEDDLQLKLRDSSLQAQRVREDQAARVGAFAMKQRVKYHHKATHTFFDAHVVGVHLDDGPDKPYYTIKYTTRDVAVDENGKQDISELIMEKQTTCDRLERVPFSEEETWKLIN